MRYLDTFMASLTFSQKCNEVAEQANYATNPTTVATASVISLQSISKSLLQFLKW